MSALMVTAFAHPADKATVRWDGPDKTIAVLELAGITVHLTHLNGDLHPWLLALSERLAEFAREVNADGSKRTLTVVES